MSPEEVRNLRPGDEVQWTDPDGESDCSRIYCIRSIRIYGDAVCITDKDGSELECLLSELS